MDGELARNLQIQEWGQERSSTIQQNSFRRAYVAGRISQSSFEHVRGFFNLLQSSENGRITRTNEEGDLFILTELYGLVNPLVYG